MATGREMHLAKAIGEYLVCAELSRRGFIATSFTGNVPYFDILAVNDKYKTTPIKVKTIRGGSWQFDAAKFLDITITPSGIQKINGKKRLPYSKLICIYIKLADSRGGDEFYIFKQAQLQNIIFKNQSKWLGEHGGRRPRNPESTHAAVSPIDLVKFRDNWRILKTN